MMKSTGRWSVKSSGRFCHERVHPRGYSGSRCYGAAVLAAMRVFQMSNPAAFASAGLDWHQDGMSLRDYFAAQAMNGFLLGARSEGWAIPNDHQNEMLARNAYATADAMLAKRNADLQKQEDSF